MISPLNASGGTDSGTPSKAGSKLAALSQDELIKLLKKQQIAHTKTKERCDELVTENENLRTLVEENKQWITRCSALEAECEALKNELKVKWQLAVCERATSLPGRCSRCALQSTNKLAKLSASNIYVDSYMPVRRDVYCEEKESLCKKSDTSALTVRCDELENTLKALDAERTDLKSALTDLSQKSAAEKTLYETHCADLMQLLQSAQAECANQKAALEESREDALPNSGECCRELRQSLDAAQADCDNYRFELDACHGRCQTLEHKLLEVEEEVANLAEENARLEHERDFGQAELFAEKDRQLLSLRETQKRVQSELSTLWAENSDLRSEICKLKEGLEQKDAEMFQAQEEWSKQKDVDNSDSAVQTDFQRSPVELQQLDELVRLENELACALVLIEQYEQGGVVQEPVECEKCKILDANINTLRVDNESQNAQLKDLREQLSALRSCEEELENHREKLEVKSSELAKVIEISEKQAAEIESLKRSVARLSDIEVQLSQAQSLSSRVRELETGIEAAEKQKFEVTAVVDEQASHIAVLKMELSQVRAELLEAQTASKFQLKEGSGKFKDEIQSLIKQFSDEKAAHDDCKKKLDTIDAELSKTKEALEQHELLVLEMGDLERSLQNLQQQLTARDEEIVNLNQLLQSKSNEILSLQKEIDLLKEQKTKREESIQKLRAVYAKTKKELADQRELAQAKVGETETVTEKLKEKDFELDALKLELSSALAQRQQTGDRLQELLSQKDRQIRTAESLKTKMQLDLETTQNELVNLKHEYNTYKIKVQAVLRQQRTSKEEEAWNDERDHLTKTTQMQLEKLRETSALLAATKTEHNILQDEYDRLNHKLRDLQLQSEQREKSLRAQLEQEKTRADHLTASQAENVRLLTRRSEQMKQEFEETLHQMQLDRDQLVDSLRTQISCLESELGALRGSTPSQRSGLLLLDADEKTLTKPLAVNVSSERHSAVEESFWNVPPLSERRPGVGSERTDETWSSQDTPKPITSPTFGSQFLPLDDLLNTERWSRQSSVPVAAVSPEDVKHLHTQVDKAQKRIEHLTEVLNESEATNARLSDQAKILKEEIRRLERNQEREQHVAKTEYLKNVVMKFLNPKIGDERAHLVPVLTTMLSLSPTEVAHLNTIAKGDEAAANQQPAGWSNYLHRWSGMS